MFLDVTAPLSIGLLVEKREQKAQSLRRVADEIDLHRIA